MKNHTKIFWCITFHAKFDMLKTFSNQVYQIDGFIRVYDGGRYLLLFGAEKYDSCYNKIRYVIGVKSGITYVISHNYSKTKVYEKVHLFEKALTFVML